MRKKILLYSILSNMAQSLAHSRHSVNIYREEGREEEGREEGKEGNGKLRDITRFTVNYVKRNFPFPL